MTGLTINETPIILTVGQVQGPPGTAGTPGTNGTNGTNGAPGPTGPSGNAQNVTTVAAHAASSFDVATQIVNIEGYTTVGVGAFRVRRVNSQPAHPWKFRSTDRFTASGATDATNGGWWEGVLENNVMNADSFGFVGDGVTDNSPVWANLQNYCFLPNPPYTATQITIRFSNATYYFASTINVNTAIVIEGAGPYFYTSRDAMTTFLFANNIGGMVFNAAYSLGMTYTAPSANPGADGAIMRGIRVAGPAVAKTPWQPTAWGILIKCRATIEDCIVEFFPNHGIAIIASASQTDWRYGNANGWRIQNVRINTCCGAGIYIRGDDTNAGVSYDLDIDNCLMGIQDDSFLGNAHFGTQCANIGQVSWTYYYGISGYISYAGNRYQIIQKAFGPTNAYYQTQAQITRPSGTTADNAIWTYIDGSGSASGVWGEVQDDDGLVYNVVVGQEANMWTNKPSTHPAVWGTGRAPTGGVGYIPWAASAAMVNLTGVYSSPYASLYDNVSVGPYCQAASYRGGSANGWAAFYGVYSEGAAVAGGTSWSYLFGAATSFGGGMELSPYSQSGTFFSKLGVPSITNQLRADSGAWYVDIGGPAGSGQIFDLWNNANWGGVLSFGANTPNYPQDLSLYYKTGGLWWYITGPQTTQTFGKSAGAAYGHFIANLFIGKDAVSSNNARQLTSGTTAPTTGNWAVGDICLNSGSGSPFAWKCTVAGAPGTWVAEYASPSQIYAPGTVATYGGYTPSIGDRGSVTDSSVIMSNTSIGLTVVGGGTNKVPVFYNGTNWIIG